MNRIAVVHDWFNCIAGSEKVVREMMACYPGSDVYSLVDHLSKEQRESLGIDKEISTSFINRLPFQKKFRNYLPFMPMAIEQFDMSDYDVVLSSSHAFAKSVSTNAQQLHISYVHTPIRYAWDLQHEYLEQQGLKRGIKSAIIRASLHYIRMWDRGTADRPDVYIANSNYIASRIRKTYNRPAHVIYPPVEIERMRVQEKKENFYLAAGRLVPYKRFDMVVEAFSKMKDTRLVVIGDGSEMKKLKSLAGDNVELMGYQSDEVLADHMQRAKAFVFGALEDFGIMPVEAQACGTPVIALGKGGTAETVEHGVTGLHFMEQNVACLTDAIQTFEELPEDYFDPLAIRRFAESFSGQRFRDEFSKLVRDSWAWRQPSENRTDSPRMAPVDQVVNSKTNSPPVHI